MDGEKWVSIKASGTEQNVSLMKYLMHEAGSKIFASRNIP